MAGKTYAAQLERLGPHRAGVVCLYLGDLGKVDLTVLEEIVAESLVTLPPAGAGRGPAVGPYNNSASHP
ncbi:hypothetical protein SAMN05216282_12038 [Cryobacterium psychrotolerans]|uniref:Uncharacterized protein n=1 Tax=Cryobacterium psychrotolerans TaxID=386301 RepID=A0A1G9G8N6_9MICO|nr:MULTISPECIES: hypothetical protein [Cryobacterium]SDK97088.1 hypothetical protein SAMN05216282_12038 [Cryobacterium psychrotolerans]